MNHNERTLFVKERLGTKSDEEILNEIRSLKLDDFNESVSCRMIESIRNMSDVEDHITCGVGDVNVKIQLNHSVDNKFMGVTINTNDGSLFLSNNELRKMMSCQDINYSMFWYHLNCYLDRFVNNGGDLLSHDEEKHV